MEKWRQKTPSLSSFFLLSFVSGRLMDHPYTTSGYFWSFLTHPTYSRVWNKRTPLNKRSPLENLAKRIIVAPFLPYTMKSGIRPQPLEKSQKINNRRATFIPDSRVHRKSRYCQNHEKMVTSCFIKKVIQEKKNIFHIQLSKYMM